MATRIEIVNRALVRIGDQPLQSETAARADIVLPLYAGAVATITSLTQWSFSRRVASLVREDATPPAPRAYQYKLPADRLGPPWAVYDSLDALKDDRAFHRYELARDLLLADADAIYIRDQITPEIDVWSPLFLDCVIVLSAAEFAGPYSSNGVEPGTNAWPSTITTIMGTAFLDAMSASRIQCALPCTDQLASLSL